MSDNQGATSRYLSFVLGESVYAIPVGKVEVVLEMQAITRVPNAKPIVCGVINHRGSVVPVIDLAVSFSGSGQQNLAVAALIVLQLECDGELASFAMLADGVREVIDLDASVIEAIPDLGTRPSAGQAGNEKFVQAIAHVSDGFVIIVDMDAVYREAAA
ncbi:MAG: hypothetical protein A2087_14260 [Spirochaetes bacterium GWD1_61_31]|nr:MAG: hypothetical protein A2Y37_04150 [Spirochaetes bacterium GWB1_60_80]OHD30572.1 MAG: hypothetical protein A2004_05535 [Spirochaetes bacterium GWC1_61_12]OHD34840.1 MAG: hypothetical protein A2087_14260 [Spirochaetes bacterium GWD1_61_31]OHD46686.1 MAG: hypothetical protein A2Y35_11085 [Spirochaetes bacterium GWE1_60_18]OHD60315.1 MAG: hypothetical protein A2Y32_14650 [Spirochaetes bacterium GWF1_60_12]HAP44213.1 chemotaxis protein CheW [Spirochaetaceae bacterium]